MYPPAFRKQMMHLDEINDGLSISGAVFRIPQTRSYSLP